LRDFLFRAFLPIFLAVISTVNTMTLPVRSHPGLPSTQMTLETSMTMKVRQIHSSEVPFYDNPHPKLPPPLQNFFSFRSQPHLSLSNFRKITPMFYHSLFACLRVDPLEFSFPSVRFRYLFLPMFHRRRDVSTENLNETFPKSGPLR